MSMRTRRSNADDTPGVKNAKSVDVEGPASVPLIDNDGTEQTATSASTAVVINGGASDKINAGTTGLRTRTIDGVEENDEEDGNGRAAKRVKTSDNADQEAVQGASTAVTIMQVATNKVTTIAPFTPTNDVSNVPLTKKSNTLTVKARTPEWITPELLQRLDGFLGFAELDTSRFAVGAVPTAAAWGKPEVDKALARYFCLYGKPLTMWILGIVETKWFHDVHGNPQDKVNIGIKTLRASDHAAAMNLRAKSVPVKKPPGERVYARRFMVQWGEDDEKPHIENFNQFFDARDGFERKSDMPRLFASQVHVGDLVLVEAALIRYKTGQVKTHWVQWGTDFELQSVCLLGRNDKGEETQEFVAKAEESDVKL
ncbi:hypothetical protein VTO73DRAFT_8914 [Trametes versicolor]